MANPLSEPIPNYTTNPLDPYDRWGVRPLYLGPVGSSYVGGDTALTMPSADVSPVVGNLGSFPVTAAANADAYRLAGNMLQFGPADVGAIKAFHGSPHLFPPTERNPWGEFDPMKIGTGEGNQAFGVGAGYVAEREGIARTYANAPHPAKGNDPRDDINSIRMNWQGAPWEGKPAVEYMSDATASSLMKSYPSLAPFAGDPVVAKNVARVINGHEPGGTISSEAMFALRALDKQLPPAPKGHMYEVEINADPEHFLDWDKPRDQLSPKVQDWAQQNYPGAWDKAADGSSLYQHIVRQVQSEYPGATKGALPPPGFNAPAQVSQEMADAGIPGIRYLDAGSRGTGTGTSNYVVFSPDIMNIIRRYGIAGLLGGTAAAGAASGGSDQQ